MAVLTYANFKLIFDKTRIEQLASQVPVLGGAETYQKTIVEAIIVQADIVVKNALCNLYTTTEIEADKSLERVCAVIAMHYLELRRNQESPAIAAEYKNVLKMLDDLRFGTTRLEGATQILPKGETQQKSYITEGDYFRGIEDTEVQ